MRSTPLDPLGSRKSSTERLRQDRIAIRAESYPGSPRATRVADAGIGLPTLRVFNRGGERGDGLAKAKNSAQSDLTHTARIRTAASSAAARSGCPPALVELA